MEVSALRYSGGLGLHGRSPLLRLQSDERLVTFTRRGNSTAFEVLVSRYHSRLLSFCRHLLGSREDAEDVLQEVFSAAFNAMVADERPINVRPWLYRIARNRSLNHLRRIQAIGVDSMDVHLFDHGTTTADMVHRREEFRLLVGDIQELPETQRTALVLREMDALSYEQIAEAMETTVPSVKSLLVRARVSLAEAAEARQLSCEEVRFELAEIAEGLRRRPGTLVRRHLRSCTRCETFRGQLKSTNKALAILLPVGPLALLRKLAIVHLTHSAASGSSASGAAAGTGAASAAAGTGAAVGSAGAGAGAGAGSLISAGIGAVATKAAAGLAAAVLVTAGVAEVSTPAAHSHAPVASASHGNGATPVRLDSGGASPAPASPTHHARAKRAVDKKATPTKATTTATTTADKTVTKKVKTKQPVQTVTPTNPTAVAPPATATTDVTTTTTTSGSSTTTDTTTTTTTGTSSDPGYGHPPPAGPPPWARNHRTWEWWHHAAKAASAYRAGGSGGVAAAGS